MAFTGKLGTTGSRFASIQFAALGGEGSALEQSVTSLLTLTDAAACNTRDVEASDTLVLTDEASTTTPHHVDATSTLSFSILVDSSIRMLSATSTLALTVTAAKNIHEVSASSALALVSAASVTILEVDAESALVLTDTAHPGMFRETATSEIALVQTLVESGVRRSVAASSALALTSTASTPRPLHKSASSALALVSTAIGVGPSIGIASDVLSLTDSARSGVWMAQAANAITLADLSQNAETFIVDASSPVSLTDSATAYNLHVYATSELVLESLGENTEKFRSALTTITLTDTATAEVIHNAISVLTLTDLAVSAAVSKRAESELELTQEARSISITVVAEEQTIALTQEATSSIKMLSIEDTLSLADTLSVLRPWYATAVSELATIEEVFDLDTFTMVEVITGLQDSASCIVDTVRSASNILSFYTQAIGSHDRADGIDCVAESELAISDLGRISIPKSASSTLAMSQSATATTSRPAISELSTLGVAADVVVVRGVSASNTIDLQQAVAFILEQADTLCTYSPFVGSSTDPNAPTPPPSTYTAAGGTPGFRLQYPASGAVTDQLILRAPNLGNQDRLSMTRINRETRGGTLIIYADPIWPKVETLLLSFSGLTREEGQSLLTFMENYLGQEIRLIDWEDRLWRGVIVNPQDPVVPDGPGCKYTASFEFEGEKV